MAPFSCSKAASVAQLAIHCFDDRGLFFLQIRTNWRYLQPPKSDTALKKNCIHRTPQILIRGPWGRQNYFKPERWSLIRICGVLLDATFHGVSSDTIGGHVRLQRPEISLICPLQLTLILGSSPPPWCPCSWHWRYTGKKFIAGINDSPAYISLPTPENEK